MNSLAERTKRELEMDDDESFALEFTGIYIRVGEDVSVTAYQMAYVSKKPLPNLGSFSPYKEFASGKMCIALLSHTILDCLYDINQIFTVDGRHIQRA